MPTVALIEDNDLNRKLIIYLLKRAGIPTVDFPHGRPGLEWLTDNDVDLVLLDIQLPELDGGEVLKRLRQTDRHAHTKVIALTAYAMRGDREKFESIGFDGYISKPINNESFLTTVRSLLGMPEPGA